MKWIPIVLLILIVGSILWAVVGLIIDKQILSWQLMWDYKYPPYHDPVVEEVNETEITDHLFENPIQQMDLDDLERVEPAKIDSVLE